jgi:hypothetical protein
MDFAFVKSCRNNMGRSQRQKRAGHGQGIHGEQNEATRSGLCYFSLDKLIVL